MTEIKIFINDQQDIVIIEAKAGGIITCLGLDASDCVKVVEALQKAIVELKTVPKPEETKP